MRRSLKDKDWRKVCLPIVEKTVKKALGAIKEANWLADLIELRMDYLRDMGGDVIKIVAFARSWEDNFNILSLIPYAKKKEQEIVAFCMGERGKMSRIFGPFMGAVWTYAALSRGKTSAPGQLTIWEMKKIWERL